MKLYLLIFLLFFGCAVAQPTTPISESNYFIYHKNNYGLDVSNPHGGVIDSKGRFWTKSYFGNYKIVNSTKITEPYLSNVKYYPVINNLFEVGDKQYLCTYMGIFVLKNDSLKQEIPLTKKDETANGFYLQHNKIYFYTYKTYDKIFSYKAFVYDFKKVKLLKQSHDTQGGLGFFTIDKMLYMNHTRNGISSLYGVQDYDLKNIHRIRFSDDPMSYIRYGNSTGNYTVHHPDSEDILVYKNYQLVDKIKIPKDYYFGSNDFWFSNTNQIQSIYTFGQFQRPLFYSFYPFNISHLIKNNVTNSYYCGNGGQLIRFFPHIQRFPKLFNNSNSSQVFTMAQTPDGKIWLGSYNGFLSVIENNSVQPIDIEDFRAMNGHILIGNKILLFGEGHKGNYLFTNTKNYKKTLENEVFFYGYKAKNGKYYLGSANNGLFEAEPAFFESFNKNLIHKKDKSIGLKLNNIITISEDKFGNIWMGQRGVAVFNPRKNKITTWHEDDHPAHFSTMCSLLDSNNILWFGSNKGELWYYEGKNADDLSFKNFRKINHPLLNDHSYPISFLHQYGNYLIMGAGERILLFDREKWHREKKILVRYLNSQETNFSAPTEQNNIFTDHRNRSIWFATSDMVYNWDINKWLSLPVRNINPHLVVKTKDTHRKINNFQEIKLKPEHNTFDIEVSYQTIDNLPRYISTSLVKKGEKPAFYSPGLQTHFNFANLSSGNYVFHVLVCQQDGTVSRQSFNIFVDSFFWQKWWFWMLISLFPIGFIFFYFRSKNEIIQTKKKLTQLNLTSLSNQFRPHFMLNALNSIASQMENMPNAEKVISYLGDSINLLYGYSQKNEFTHDFSQEWRLVENFIEIQKILYLPELKTKIYHKEMMPPAYRLPVGLLQIPIENALLHGLRNKEGTDYLLHINFSENENFFIIEIIDNGVGRKKAAEIHQFKKNGKGLKTVSEMVKIINQFTENSIIFNIIDLDDNCGTKVVVHLNKLTNYEKIKL